MNGAWPSALDTAISTGCNCTFGSLQEHMDHMHHVWRYPAPERPLEELAPMP